MKRGSSCFVVFFKFMDTSFYLIPGNIGIAEGIHFSDKMCDAKEFINRDCASNWIDHRIEFNPECQVAKYSRIIEVPIGLKRVKS